MLLLVLLLSIQATPNAHAQGEWPEPRQNGHLTGIQPMAGRMAEAPVELARYDLGRHAPAVTRCPDGNGAAGIALVQGALQAYDASGETLWICHPPGINFESIAACRDLDGDGSVEVLLKAGRPTAPFGAAVLADLTSGEVVWRYDVDPMSYAWYLQTRRLPADASAESIVVLMMGYPPDPENGYIAVFDSGSDRGITKRWRYDFEEYTCFPSLLYPDLNNDGKEEIAVQTHSRMWIFDAASGERSDFVKWDVSPANVRSYGRIEFADLDKDGDEDFLCLADFAQHHEVLLNTDGKLEKAWHYGWPESVTTGKVVSTWPEPPYADVDGDGANELVVSMYNGDGEQRWRVRVYDIVTGEMEYDFDGAIAASLGDVDGDGSHEILGNLSNDPLQQDFNGAILLKAAAKEAKPSPLAVLWRDDDAAALKGLQAGSGNPSRNSGHYSVQLHGDNALVVRRDGVTHALKKGENWSLKAWNAPASDETPLPPIAAPAVIGNAAPELLAADLWGDGKNELLMYKDGTAEVFALNGNSLDAINTFDSSILPLLADLDADGKREIVTATIVPSGPPRVRASALNEKDQILWDVTLPTPSRSGLAQPRAGYMRAGRFTGRDGDDIYLFAGTPIVRSMVIDGSSGEIVWERGEIPDSERYWAPTVNLASRYDYDNDGADDLVFTNPDYYCVASGKTGELLLGPAFPPEIFDQPSQGLYTLPAILPRKGASPFVALVAGHYFQGVMTAGAKPKWHRIPLVGEHSPKHEGFIKTADGAWMMGYGRQDGRFDCVNVADGTVCWTLDLNATCSSVIACDVDGDGRDEFVFGTSHGELIAVGDGGDSPRIVWRKDLGAPAGDPIAADLDGGGTSEIVVPTGDGFVRVLAEDAQ